VTERIIVGPPGEGYRVTRDCRGFFSTGADGRASDKPTETNKGQKILNVYCLGGWSRVHNLP
jgi:hypothetical protein